MPKEFCFPPFPLKQEIGLKIRNLGGSLVPVGLGPAVGAAQGLFQLGKGLGWGQVPLLTFNL